MNFQVRHSERTARAPAEGLGFGLMAASSGYGSRGCLRVEADNLKLQS